MRLFINIIPYVQASIFSGSCYEVSSANPIYHVEDSDTMKKFMSLTHLIKLVQKTDSLRKYCPISCLQAI
jgi:hypothetical protein